MGVAVISASASGISSPSTTSPYNSSVVIPYNFLNFELAVIKVSRKGKVSAYQVLIPLKNSPFKKVETVGFGNFVNSLFSTSDSLGRRGNRSPMNPKNEKQSEKRCGWSSAYTFYGLHFSWYNIHLYFFSCQTVLLKLEIQKWIITVSNQCQSRQYQ